jgi:hypothetical protein
MPSRPALLVRLEMPSPRARYVFDHIFERLLGLKIRYLAKGEDITGWSGPLICYGGTPDPLSLHFPASPILQETGIDHTLIERISNNLSQGVFPTDTGPLPFDPFASAFFLLSRYEEYLPFVPDNLGRFPSTASLIHRMGVLDVPLVDRWALDLADMLEIRFPGLKCVRPEYTFIPTYDIDVAFAYRGRPLWRMAGATARGFIRNGSSDLKGRVSVMMGKVKDPYDVYDELIAMHQRFGLKARWFIPAGLRGERDHNLDPGHPAMRSLLQQLMASGTLGLHPSFGSNATPSAISKEKARLEKASGQVIEHSRQHYLMLQFPGTYRNLLNAGFKADHTMGYADCPGFRAGTTRPFRFYDLEKEQETELMVHPFALMDGSLRDYQRLSPGQARESIDQLIASVRGVGGIFCSLWHNSSLSGIEGWQDWKSVYEYLVTEAVKS